MRVLAVIGTRPEVIKMAPVISALQATAEIEIDVAWSGQHIDLAQSALVFFGITPTYTFEIMNSHSGSGNVTAAVLKEIDGLLSAKKFDLVIVQGDTSTAVGAAMAAYYRNVPVAHVEAGLRSGNLFHPHPEEGNRQIIDRVSQLLFCPTEKAKKNLIMEGLDQRKLYMTGNTVVDALQKVLGKPGKREPAKYLNGSYEYLILLTTHRRESFGRPLERIFSAVKQIALRNPGVRIVFPVHPNPVVKQTASLHFAGVPNVMVIPPLDYPEFIDLLASSDLVLTDSGGLQEEAPALGKYVLVLRETTERPEAIEEGMAELVGTGEQKILVRTEELLRSGLVYEKKNPFGDGRAGVRIASAILEFLEGHSIVEAA